MRFTGFCMCICVCVYIVRKQLYSGDQVECICVQQRPRITSLRGRQLKFYKVYNLKYIHLSVSALDNLPTYKQVGISLMIHAPFVLVQFKNYQGRSAIHIRSSIPNKKVVGLYRPINEISRHILYYKVLYLFICIINL